MKNVKLLLSMIVLAAFAAQLSGATVAYYEMDDWNTRTVFADVAGANQYNLTRHYSESNDGFVGANPIPNPDPGPFLQGDPVVNTRSLKQVRGALGTTSAAFTMTSSSSWTFEGWFNRTGSSGTNYLAGTRGIESNWAGWEFTVLTTGRLDLRMSNTLGASTYANTGSNVLALNTWYHVALTWDHDAGANGTASIFIDGVLAGSGAGNGDLGPAKSFYVGGRDKAADGIYKATEMGYNGYMDELRLSDEVLTPSEFLNAPEPATMGLLAAGLFFVRKRK